MDNKIQETPAGLVQTPVNAVDQSVANPPFSGQIPAAPPAKVPMHSSRRSRNIVFITMVVFVLVTAGAIVASLIAPNKEEGSSSLISPVEIPLGQFLPGDNLSLLGTRNLTINGRLQANDAFIISPSAQPANGTAGQIYYDKTSNELA
ncbi:MAG TPA: hypothetical protein VFT87_04620, partial [Candidatus Saccharimonadales bacterium]|nr:hypothetical protein [Candidatus Saccharimonadales bacterium]